MRIATLFSGIGSPEQAAKRVYPNHEVVFACEFDKFARQSYEANYEIEPEHFHKDVNDLDATEYKGMVDILIGGSPCQSFSLAGLRKGTEDHRGELIYQYIRVVDECRPEIIVYENVKGIMSIDGGQTIKDFVQALRDIGYHCHYDVVNTKDYGVPQNRERLFLVGFLDHDLYHRFEYAPKIQLEKRLKDVLEDYVNEKYYLNRELNFDYKSQANTVHSVDKIAPTLCAFTHGYAGGYIKKTVPTFEEWYKDTKKYGGTKEEYNELYLRIKVPSATKQGYETATTGDSINLSVPNSKIRRGRVGKQVAQTLDTACNQAVVQDRIRKLTERECLRLQDFPDDFIQVVSSSQMYKQAGNSMSVNILEMIFNQIEKAKSKEKTNTLMDFIGDIV